MELLFFDTFSHDTNEELNLDLVQFPRPVCIYEVRIIPLGSRVQADFPGGVRLGATNPSSFPVDFFVNDLSKAGASNFAKLGNLEYKQNVTIQLCANSKIPTDGLVLRGWYSTVTLAVFGVLTKVVKEKSPSPPSPPPPPPPRIQPIPSAPATIIPQAEPKPSEVDPAVQLKQTVDWHMHDAQRQPEHPGLPVAEVHPAISYLEQPATASYSVEQYSQDPAYLPPASVYPEQAPDYRPAPAEYNHAAQYPEPSWPAASQAQPYVAPDRGAYQPPPTEESYSQEQRHRLPRESVRDYHRDHRSRSTSRDRDYSRDYKDKDSDFSQESYGREHEDRHYRDSRHKRSSYNRSKDREGRHTRSRSRDPTPHKDKRPHSPPLPRSALQTSPVPGPPSPHSRSLQCSPSYTPPPDDRDRKSKDKDDIRNKPSDSWKEHDKRDANSSKASDNSDADEENDGFEEILSEEEGMFDVDEVIDMVEDYEGDDVWNFMSSFNPYQFEITELTYYNHPKLTEYEVNQNRLKHDNQDVLPESAKKVIDLVKQLNQDERNEKWVECIEMLSQVILEGLIHLPSQQYEEILDHLMDWSQHSLDYEKALCQAQPVFKIRHLKAGIKLTTTLFNSDNVIVRKLCEQKIPDMLLELFVKEHMALSIKLLLLKAIDVLTNNKVGIVYFCKGLGKAEETCYQKIVKITLSDQLTRTMVAIKALLRKVHLYELLCKLKLTVSQMVSRSYREDEVNADLDATDAKLNENNIEDIIASVVEMKTVLQSAHTLISQPGRSFPLRKLFSFQKAKEDYHPGLFTIFDSCNILESICVLLTSPITAGHSGICRTIRGLLQVMLSTHHGMLYLLSHPTTTIVIIRTLLQVPDELQEVGPNDDTETQQLGLQLAYYLHTLQLVDSLLNFQKQENALRYHDNADTISMLQNLFSLVFSHVGRSAVVTILSNDKNLESILPFIESTGDEKLDSLLHRSTAHGYACELILLMLRSSSSVNMLQNFSRRLLNITAEESSSKLNEIIQWVSATKNVQNYTTEDVEPLMNIIKECSKDVGKISPELVTSLRILQHLCMAPDLHLPASEKQEELKNKYAVIQVFAHDGLSIFTTLLQKLCADNISITNDASHLIGQAGAMLTAAFQPLCILIKNMLSYLIYCRTTEFKDLTALPTLLEAFHFLSMIPVSSPHQPEILKIQKVLVEMLLAYTQPILSQAHESDEAISKSLWTQMVMEVLKFIQKAPRTFVSGLNIISELLPVPLPIQTREALTQEEITKAINIRKLWCAHLHPLSLNIHQLINSLCGASCPNLQHVLKRVCLQLADLAAPTSITVVKAILTSFVENASAYSTATAVDEIDSSVHDQVSRILNLLVYLMSNPAIKVTMLHLINGGYKTDERSTDLLPFMLNILMSKSTKQGHVQVQECILSILQSLCDSEITLMSSDTGLSVQEQLSNTVPPKEQLVLTFSALIDVLGRDRQDLVNSYTSLLLTMRTMLLLTEHDYGFYHLKIALEEEKEAIFKFLIQLSDHFSKELTEFVALMSTLLELLRQLTSIDEDNTTVVMPRKMCMSIAELATLLKWKKMKKGSELPESSAHPLLTIQSQIIGCLGDEEGLDGLQDSVSVLIQLLNEALSKDDDEKDVTTEPILPGPDTLSNQFGARATFMIADSDDDRLSPSYWFCQPSFEDGEFDADQQVDLDLIDMSEKLCPNLDLKATLEKAYMPNENFTSKDDSVKSSTTSSLARSIGKKRYQPFINPGKRDFQGGSRGRNFSRGGMTHGRLNDPFRSRPPNTSRPPSMHVDDFVALENTQSGSNSGGASGSSNNGSQLSKRSTKYKVAGSGSNSQKGMARDNARPNRNWGIEHHQFASSGRGRFFNGSPYGRRENGRGNNNMAARGGARNSNARPARNNTKVPGPSPRPLSRLSYDSRQPIARQRDIYPASWVKGRAGNGSGAHWAEPRSRFGSGNSRGRREGNSRHSRTVTR